ncbi:transporter substrate-binding domain-containing protein [Suttonella ornithocola]|uniref:Glutamine ABC transporter periplasmic protein n=1 Tax=Suttonella ornithocola TaxID=279832 RepID=A0A380MNX6_9GAMM|nr:transporter substrate-binding domain-containing protein [Suttonella ornithocola]SUO93736.1 glutamine ABC transporter periplasmic protein [Suttonella ornithocola]
MKKNKDIKNLSDFKGKIFTGYVESKSSREKADQLSQNDTTYIPANSFFSVLKNVWQARADAIVVDDLIPKYYGVRYPEIKYRMLPLPDADRNIGFIIKKGDTTLKEKIDHGLEVAKKDGSYQKLYQSYFGN